MSYSSFIASRYFRSRQHDGFVSFVTGIAIVGVMLGSATLIIALSVLGGFEKEITDKVIGFTSHVQVLGFQGQPLRGYVRNAMMLEDSLPSISAVAPFVAREALIRSKDGVDGILLKGIDPLRDVSSTATYIVAGRYEIDRERGGLPKLVVGKKLAARLSLNVGDRATIFGIGRLVEQSRFRVMQFVISGLYESGMSEYDDVYAFTDLEDAQTIFQLGDAVTGYDIMVTRLDSVDAVAQQVKEMLGYPHYARTVFQSYRNIFSWIKLQKEPVPIILGLIIAVATVNIIGTLLMLVLGKTREIGILISMGATRWGITKIFLRQGMTIAFLGTILGNIVGGGLCMAQKELHFFSLPSDVYFMSTVPILVKPEYFVVVSALSLVLCFISALVPSRLAARLDPVYAIRFA
jgi:lipoprotein-releasing system permease protein